MNAFAGLRLELRMAALFIIGLLAGAAVNWFVDRLRFEPTAVSPWSRPPEGLRRRRRHRLPLVGWLARRHEAPHYGELFWLRPLLVELSLALVLPWLYWFEVVEAGLLPAGFAPPADGAINTQLVEWLQACFVSHAILLVLMLVAALVDLDDKIIPDLITVPGTLLGLLLAALWPACLLPEVIWNGGGAPHVTFVTLASPNAPPVELGPRPAQAGLWLALGCFAIWCGGLLPRPWRSRHGWRRAAALLVARVAREPSSLVIGAVAVLGTLGISLVWWRGGDSWVGLLTALVGMAAAGGIVWLVRRAGTLALGREAMGFGDVTLMAMIGSFLGWQAGLLIFFVAPFWGLASVVLMAIGRALRRSGAFDPEIPYGPFLCLGAATVTVRWAPWWDWAQVLFGLGWLVPTMVLVALGLLTLMLAAWRGLAGRRA
ncbi:MAG: A24 family peptidase [Pirellulales bacterium]|nr:A24 family peptidase [Pirellulales bacterium]